MVRPAGADAAETGAQCGSLPQVVQRVAWAYRLSAAFYPLNGQLPPLFGYVTTTVWRPSPLLDPFVQNADWNRNVAVYVPGFE